jgi:ATP/maltotriose-dependent transcriptional regulator MalT
LGQQSFDVASTTLPEPLSNRELEVLRLIAHGKTNQEIAAELYIAVTTAKKHVSNIIGKLGVTNRTQAVARAQELDLL